MKTRLWLVPVAFMSKYWHIWQNLVTAFTSACARHVYRILPMSCCSRLAIAFGSQQKDRMLQDAWKTKVDREHWTNQEPKSLKSRENAETIRDLCVDARATCCALQPSYPPCLAPMPTGETGALPKRLISIVMICHA